MPIDCKHYCPPWEGNKNTNSKPDWCLKWRVTINGKCIKDCKHYEKDKRK
jgi:hypothetical protein